MHTSRRALIAAAALTAMGSVCLVVGLSTGDSRSAMAWLTISLVLGAMPALFLVASLPGYVLGLLAIVGGGIIAIGALSAQLGLSLCGFGAVGTAAAAALFRLGWTLSDSMSD